MYLKFYTVSTKFKIQNSTKSKFTKSKVLIEEKIEVHDLGLPSGTLWTLNYLEDEEDDTFQVKALTRTLISEMKELKAKLIRDLQAEGGVRSKEPNVYLFKAKAPSGKIVTETINGLSKLDVNAFLINEGYDVYAPIMKYCTDNASMVASAAFFFDKTLSVPKIGSPNLRAIFDFGPIYLAIFFNF